LAEDIALDDIESEANLRAAHPSYRVPWPMRLPPVGDSYDVRDAYTFHEVQQPYVDEPPRAPVPAVKLEPELDPIPDAIGQPPFTPGTGRPTAFWDMRPASKRGEPIAF
jgi:hypothetical protein